MTTRVSLHRLLVVSPAVLLAVLFCINCYAPRAYAEEATATGVAKSVKSPAWLEGTGEDLRIRLSGEVLGEDGAPAEGFRLEVVSETRFGERALPVEIKGNRFSFWVPVGEAVPFPLVLNAASSDGRQIARETLLPFQIRQAATEGLVLTLKRPGRMVRVEVLKDGKPAAGASVAVGLAGPRITSKTDGLGVATFGLMKREMAYQLTAWTEDFAVGGYPTDTGESLCNPRQDKYTVELEPCRSRKIRVISAEDGSPLPGVDVMLMVSGGPAHDRYLGRTPDCKTKTDEGGEVVHRWIPAVEKPCVDVLIRDPRWMEWTENEIVDGVIVVKARKSKLASCKRVTGRVASPDGNVGGLLVEMTTRQGSEYETEFLEAFTDEHGGFTADFLPGATYCCHVRDIRFISDFVALIPFDPKTGKTTAPMLTQSQGQPVEVTLTTGPENRPIASQFVGFETRHAFSWRDDGTTREGKTRRHWSIKTDEHGRIRTRAQGGKEITVAVYRDDWVLRQSVQVKTEGTTKLALHREMETGRKVRGRLIPPPNLKADLNDAVVEIGSLDGDTRERFSRKSNPDGEFEFSSQASRVALYAHTRDAKAAGVCVVDKLDEPLAIKLLPTSEFRGRLIDGEGRPLAKHGVFVFVREDGCKTLSTRLSAFPPAAFTRTDDEGNYSFAGLPSNVELTLEAEPFGQVERERYLGQLFLVPGESRRREVSRLANAEADRSFAGRYRSLLRNCRLSNCRLMVILSRPSDETRQFIDANLADYNRTKEIMGFIRLQGETGEGPADRDAAEFAKSRDWPMPEAGKVLAFALDATGKELGRTEFDCEDAEGPDLAAEFICKYAPKQVNAKEKWAAAFAEAKRTNRKVWAGVGQPYCGPCIRLARWLDEQKETL